MDEEIDKFEEIMESIRQNSKTPAKQYSDQELKDMNIIKLISLIEEYLESVHPIRKDNSFLRLKSLYKKE